MKGKDTGPVEDPATTAQRNVETARAEADLTAQTQATLDRRTRRVLRVFGARAAASGSGSSGVPFTKPAFSGFGTDPGSGGGPGPGGQVTVGKQQPFVSRGFSNIAF